MVKKIVKINIYEGLTFFNFLVCGYALIPQPSIGIIYFILGLYSYGKLIKLVSDGKYIPFWEAFKNENNK